MRGRRGVDRQREYVSEFGLTRWLGDAVGVSSVDRFLFFLICRSKGVLKFMIQSLASGMRRRTLCSLSKHFLFRSGGRMAFANYQDDAKH